MKSFLGNFYRHLAIFSGHTVSRAPEIRGLNPVIRMFYLLSTVLSTILKNENKEKVAGKGLINLFYIKDEMID